MRTLAFDYPELLCRLVEYLLDANGMPSEALLADIDPLPAGIISPYGGITPPAGWLLCNGSPHSRLEQQRLFAAIGTIYGAGDGVNTFNVPNLNGRFPIGSVAVDYPLGDEGGAKVIPPESLPPHHHYMFAHYRANTVRSLYDAVPDRSVPLQRWVSASYFNYFMGEEDPEEYPPTHGLTSNGPGQAEPHLPPFLAQNYIIRS